MESPNTRSLAGWMRDSLGSAEPELVREFRTFYAAKPAFRTESEAHETKDADGR
jgi:hypothetical protein